MKTLHDYNRVVIVGCGNLGSKIAYILALYSLEHELVIELIDCDILQKHHLPYLSLTSYNNQNNYVGQPKAYVLHSELLKINPNLDITSYYKSYDHCTDYNEEAIMVDTRDVDGNVYLFDYSVATDGIYGKIDVNPLVKPEKNARYSYKRSDFYSMMTAFEFVKRITMSKYKTDANILCTFDLHSGETIYYDKSSTTSSDSIGE